MPRPYVKYYIWTCPRCRYQEEQPESCVQMWHPCPKGKTLVVDGWPKTRMTKGIAIDRR